MGLSKVKGLVLIRYDLGTEIVLMLVYIVLFDIGWRARKKEDPLQKSCTPGLRERRTWKVPLI